MFSKVGFVLTSVRSSAFIANCHNRLTRKFSVSTVANMRFVQFQKEGGPKQIGAQLSPEGDIFEISALDSTIPNCMVKFLAHDGALDKAKRIISAGKSLVSYQDVTILPPITNPDKVACVGLNYKTHCDEQNKKHPTEPMFFSKFASCITGPFSDVHLPKISDCVDFEVELAVVIGKQGKEIRKDQAQDYIFGYTIAQDISARDWQKQRNNGQFLLGKSMDTFCPLGPCIVPKEFLQVNDLTLKTWINGQLKQEGQVSDMVFNIDYLVSYLSQIVTLYPGDLILTGTPSGVGMHRNPPEYLKSGDVIESEIEGIGKMRNQCK